MNQFSNMNQLRRCIRQAYGGTQMATFPVSLHSLYREYVLPDYKQMQIDTLNAENKFLQKRVAVLEDQLVILPPLVEHSKRLERRVNTLEEELMELKLKRDWRSG